jgi:hypothetical protein
MAIIDEIIQAQLLFQETLLKKANVIGVAVGYKNRLGETTGDLSLVALVESKVPIAALSAEDMVPKELDGAKTDVFEIGTVQALATLASPLVRYRPAPGGVSSGHPLVGAGTLGALVKDATTGEPLVLSNNHVYAASNDALIGDPILQPGALDGGQNPADVVAKLERFVKLQYEGDPPADEPKPPPTDRETPKSTCDIVNLIVAFANLLARLNGSDQRVQAVPRTMTASTTTQATSYSNKLDAALARPTNPAFFTDEVRHIGRITGTKVPTLGMRVRKAGRTTDYTEGNVTLLNATVNVGYRTKAGNKTARFVGQTITTVMSQPGDSGSLVVEVGENNAVGLLFAGSSVSTIFTPIDVVMAEMNIRF